MNSWTISRRISVGFASLLVITLLLGVFALWRLHSLREDLTEMAGNSLPSIMLLGESGALSRDNMILAQRYLHSDTKEQRDAIEQAIATNRARIDQIYVNYEPLISDSEDRRLFEEAKRTRTEFASARNRLLELARLGRAEEAKRWLMDAVLPAYEASIVAVRNNVDYNSKAGATAGADGRRDAESGVRIILVVIVLAVGVNAGMAAWVVRSTNRVLRGLAGDLDQGAVQTAAAARQVAAASQSLSSGASEQAASVEETSASLEEMSTMIRSTAENAQKAKVLAGEARTVAETGSRTMGEMNDAMAAINASAAEVAKIVKNIDEIAFQTNILALNAAVEAARAGEAGAGFAVVADEVRSLAQRSAAAAKETADKIEAAIASSRQGSRSCARVGESLTQIADKVSATDALVADIATAAREQAQGIGQINIAINQMDGVTQSNSANAEEGASAAEELDAQAESLKDMVGQLRRLVGGTELVRSDPVPVTPRYSVSSSPTSTASRSRPRGSQPLPESGTPRRGIPMPGDPVKREGGDDDHFRNF
ncbi:MAG: MCP four helix bundle domain-containing protein [Verrucomicrobiales bacterium]|nr:MCP four helix bundle domain-containing protein [Verrucomicrobiales bacterium]